MDLPVIMMVVVVILIVILDVHMSCSSAALGAMRSIGAHLCIWFWC
jgi:hypothetical protein